MGERGFMLLRDAHFIDDGGKGVPVKILPSTPPKTPPFLNQFGNVVSHSLGNGMGARGFFNRKQF